MWTLGGIQQLREPNDNKYYQILGGNKLLCPGRGPASGSPRRGPDVSGAGQVGFDILGLGVSQGGSQTETYCAQKIHY